MSLLTTSYIEVQLSVGTKGTFATFADVFTHFEVIRPDCNTGAEVLVGASRTVKLRYVRKIHFKMSVHVHPDKETGLNDKQKNAGQKRTAEYMTVLSRTDAQAEDEAKYHVLNYRIALHSQYVLRCHEMFTMNATDTEMEIEYMEK